MIDTHKLTEDIFKNWKENRFVLMSTEDSGLRSDYPYLVILADIGYWNEHHDELEVWCEENSCQRRGMTVEISNEAAAAMFTLRWL